MAGRTILPLLALGAVGFTAASLGLGYSLAHYAVSGIDPFYATARSSTWQQASPSTEQTRSPTAEQFAAVFEPDAKK